MVTPKSGDARIHCHHGANRRQSGVKRVCFHDERCIHTAVHRASATIGNQCMDPDQARLIKQLERSARPETRLRYMALSQRRNHPRAPYVLCLADMPRVLSVVVFLMFGAPALALTGNAPPAAGWAARPIVMIVDTRDDLCTGTALSR